MRKILATALVAVMASAIGATAHAAQQTTNGAVFVSVASHRVLDTRLGGPRLGPGGHVNVKDHIYSPVDNAIAMVLNVTGTNPTEGTYLALGVGDTMPTVSNLNLRAKETRANQVTVPVDADNSVNLFNKNGSVDATADVIGYYVIPPGTGEQYASSDPQRLLDTRNTGQLKQGKTVSIDLTGKVPDDAQSVTVNLTGTDATNYTYLSLYQSGSARPEISSLNLDPHTTTPNLVTVYIGDDHRINLYNNAGTADAVVDLVGYYSNQAGATFRLADPQRVEDTRTDGKTIQPNSTLNVDTKALTSGERYRAVSALVNLTGIASTGTYLTGWSADGSARPFTSNLNLAAGQTASNAANIPLSYGNFNLYNSAGRTDAIVDLQGYFLK